MTNQQLVVIFDTKDKFSSYVIDWYQCLSFPGEKQNLHVGNIFFFLGGGGGGDAEFWWNAFIEIGC